MNYIEVTDSREWLVDRDIEGNSTCRLTEMIAEPFNLFYVLPLAICGELLMGILD